MFFDRPQSGELAILVHLDIPNSRNVDDPIEFEELALSAGADPAEFVSCRRISPHAKFFVGTGKAEEIHQLVIQHEAQIVIFNHELSPSQERNLEAVFECRVLDRTGLILDIFAQRARTHEGKLQVELAQLQHMSTRLIRGWTHLERQKGGIGMRGPGETQLETDRRLLRARIKAIQARLDKVRKQRDQGRRSRARAQTPTISLVGYTNAGKSTLFNRITDAGVFAEDKLFATLDPTMRRIDLPSVGGAVLADTVGFISNLPHRLVDAFRATLEEAASSDMLLHVIDGAAEERLRNIEQVNIVLEEIKANELPSLLVYNKIDLMDSRAPGIDRDADGNPVAVWLSAQTGEGVEFLFEAIAERLSENVIHKHLVMDTKLGSCRAKLYQQKAILSERFLTNGDIELEIRLSETDLNKILSSESLSLDDFQWLNGKPNLQSFIV